MEQKSKKILFLDRDGVINKKADEHSYIINVENFVFNQGVFQVASFFYNKGYQIIIITNQRGISRGLMTEDDLKNIHRYMKDVFEERGIFILDILFCPHGNNECDCRKPKDGMLKMACAKYDIDIRNSLLISDTDDDVTMGKNFGLVSYKVPADEPEAVMSYFL